MTLDVEFNENSKELTANFSENEQRINAEFDSVIAVGVDTESAYNEGYEEGKKAEYDRRWDNYQINGGNVTDYQNSFSGHRWNNITFDPKYNIITSNAYMMFRYSNIEGDLTQILKDLNITLDFSKCTESFSYCFQGCQFTKLGVIDMSSLKSKTNTSDNMFSAVYLEEIELIRTDREELLKFGASAFNNATKLKKVRFEGKIVEGISFKVCPLDLESAKNIITALKDYSGTANEYSYTVYFSPSTLALLEAEGTTAPNGDTWKAYAYSKGWNI